VDKQTYLPLICYSMSKIEKISLCQCLKGFNTLQMLKSLLSKKDFKLFGLNLHDCHILMQILLHVAIHGILPKNVVITCICSSFSSIYSKFVDPPMLDELEEEIMAHLLIHLVSVREESISSKSFHDWKIHNRRNY